MSDLRPETRELIEKVEAAAPRQHTPKFERIRESLLYVQACTSLSDEDAADRMNELPSGTSGGWMLITEGDNAPVPCADKPETHRHLLFEC